MTHIRPPGRMIFVLVLLAVLAGCDVDLEGAGPEGTPAPTDTSDYRSVELQVQQQQGFTLALVPVTIKGEGPFRFALDTGASATVVAADIAAELELPVTGEERQVYGVIGANVVEVVEVAEWTLGDIPLESAEIAMIDMPSPPQGERLDGLLGSDVLSRFGRVVVDYDRERLELPPEQ